MLERRCATKSKQDNTPDETHRVPYCWRGLAAAGPSGCFKDTSDPKTNYVLKPLTQALSTDPYAPLEGAEGLRLRRRYGALYGSRATRMRSTASSAGRGGPRSGSRLPVCDVGALRAGGRRRAGCSLALSVPDADGRGGGSRSPPALRLYAAGAGGEPAEPLRGSDRSGRGRRATPTRTATGAITTNSMRRRSTATATWTRRRS